MILSFLLLPIFVEGLGIPDPKCGANNQEPGNRPFNFVFALDLNAGSSFVLRHAFLYAQLACAVEEFGQVGSTVQLWTLKDGTCRAHQERNVVQLLRQMPDPGGVATHRRSCETVKQLAECTAPFMSGNNTMQFKLILAMNFQDVIEDCDFDNVVPSGSSFTFGMFGRTDLSGLPEHRSINYFTIPEGRVFDPVENWMVPRSTADHFRSKMKNANPIFRYLVKRFDRMLLSLTTTKGTTPKVRKVAKLETTTTANPTTKILSTTAENLTALDFPNSSLSTTTQVFDFPTTTIEEILSSTSQIFLDPTLPSTTIDVDETNITQDISSTFPTETTTESTTELVPSSVFTLDEFSTTSETNAPEIVPEIPDAISDSATDAPHEVDEPLNSKIGKFFGDERYGILFVVFLVIIFLIISCAVGLSCYCLWPKYHHNESLRHTNTKVVQPVQTQSGSAEVPEIKVIKKEDPNQMKEVTAEEPVETIKISKENPSKKETTLNKPVPSSDASSKKEVNMPQSTMTKTKTEMLMVEEPIPPTPSALTPAPSSISQVDKQSMQFAGSKTADAQSLPELAATVTASKIGD